MNFINLISKTEQIDLRIEKGYGALPSMILLLSRMVIVYKCGLRNESNVLNTVLRT